MRSADTNRDLDRTRRDAVYRTALDEVIRWIEKCRYTSYDAYDIVGTPLVVYLRSRSWDPVSIVSSKEPEKAPAKSLFKTLAAPLYQTTASTRMLRLLLGARKTIHPKAMGLLAQGYASLYRTTKDDLYLGKLKFCLGWLMQNTNNDTGKYCWGLPYVWQTVRPSNRIPKYAPQSTLTAVNALAFVDAFEITGDQQYLDVAHSSCEFFLRDLHIDVINERQLAFSYTQYDKTHVLNVNLHCGALLARVWKHTRHQEYLDHCMKGTDFTVSHQRPDGAWHYSSHLDGHVNAVDNTHTGDNLEYLHAMKTAVPDFPYTGALQRGLDYYLAHFFLEDGRPKFTDELVYPTDIHSCSQSAITLSLLAGFDERCAPQAESVIDWILHTMRDPKGYFYYRQYEGGRMDRHDFIGWGDSWMMKALALYFENVMPEGIAQQRK